MPPARKTSIGWDGMSATSLADALARAAPHCIESDIDDPKPLPGARRGRARRLCLQLSASSAYRHPIARVFVEALDARIHFAPDVRDCVRSALQEALVNAMLHGNLGLASNPWDNLQGLALSHRAIETRLAMPAIARSVISLDASWTRSMLTIVVRDGGSGFKRGDVAAVGDARLSSGRGLAILDALCDRVALSHGGTAIELGFSLT